MLLRRRLSRAAGMTKEEAYKGFLIHLSRLSPSTQDGYGRAVKRLLDDSPDDLSRFTAEGIERHILYLHKTRKASTVNKSLTGIKMFFRWLEDFKNLPNPAQKIKLLKQLPSKQRILSQEEYQKVIQATSGDRQNVLSFLGNSGLRASEFLSLRKENIADGFLTVLSTKTRKIRRIPINANIKSILDANPNFFNLLKSHNRKWLYKLCCKAAKQANIEKFGPHSLRHYFITALILKGVPLNVVAKLAGDKPETLNLVYIHINDLDLQGTTDCLT